MENTPQSPSGGFLRVNYVASQLGLSAHQVRQLIKSGDLHGRRIGGLMMITRDSFERFKRENDL